MPGPDQKQDEPQEPTSMFAGPIVRAGLLPTVSIAPSPTQYTTYLSPTEEKDLVQHFLEM